MVQDHVLAGLIDQAFATELAEQAGDRLAGQAGHAAEFLVGERQGKGDRSIFFHQLR